MDREQYEQQQELAETLAAYEAVDAAEYAQFNAEMDAQEAERNQL